MTKDRRFFIHIGPSKTGTTALQTYFNANAPQQIHYPDAGKWLDTGHHRLAYAVAGRTEFFGWPLDPDLILTECAKELRHVDRDVLISSEAFSDICAQDDTFLARVQEWFKDLNREVIFIFTLRHPLARAASLYKHLLCSVYDGLRLTPRQYLEQEAQNLLIDSYLSQLDRLGIKYRTIQYEPASSFVPRFLADLGIGDERYAFLPKNTSFPDVFLPVFLCINQAFEERRIRAKVKRVLLLRAEKWEPEQPAWVLNDADIAWFSDLIEHDRAQLAARNIEYPEVRIKPRYRLQQPMRKTVRKFLTRQMDHHSDHLRAGIRPDDLIDQVFQLFR